MSKVFAVISTRLEEIGMEEEEVFDEEGATPKKLDSFLARPDLLVEGEVSLPLPQYFLNDSSSLVIFVSKSEFFEFEF